jgi:hypothetical protein
MYVLRPLVKRPPRLYKQLPQLRDICSIVQVRDGELLRQKMKLQ